MKKQMIKTLKKGDLFKLTSIRNGQLVHGNTVWVFDGYDRSTKKYGGYKFVDIADFKYWPGTRMVTTDFIF